MCNSVDALSDLPRVIFFRPPKGDYRALILARKRKVETFLMNLLQLIRAMEGTMGTILATFTTVRCSLCTPCSACLLTTT